jgi:hypothetical protein
MGTEWPTYGADSWPLTADRQLSLALWHSDFPLLLSVTLILANRLHNSLLQLDTFCGSYNKQANIYQQSSSVQELQTVYSLTRTESTWQISCVLSAIDMNLEETKILLLLPKISWNESILKLRDSNDRNSWFSVIKSQTVINLQSWRVLPQTHCTELDYMFTTATNDIHTKAVRRTPPRKSLKIRKYHINHGTASWIFLYLKQCFMVITVS